MNPLFGSVLVYRQGGVDSHIPTTGGVRLLLTPSGHSTPRDQWGSVTKGSFTIFLRASFSGPYQIETLSFCLHVPVNRASLFRNARRMGTVMRNDLSREEVPGGLSARSSGTTLRPFFRLGTARVLSTGLFFASGYFGAEEWSACAPGGLGNVMGEGSGPFIEMLAPGGEGA